jgi:hypothetical protein
MNDQGFGNKRYETLLISQDSSLASLVCGVLVSIGCGCKAATCAELNTAFAQETFDTVILDATLSETTVDTALSWIKESRPSLWRRILVVSSLTNSPHVRELIERYGLPEIDRANVRRQLWPALQDLIAPQPKPEIPSHTKTSAEMTFDSARGFSPTGLRGLRVECRQLIFQYQNSTVDILIEPRDDSGRIAITGQILHNPRSPERDGGLPVLLVAGIRTMRRTHTNRMGEFYLECAPLQEASLEIKLREGGWVALNVGDLDWSAKKLAAGR